jgi:hypothetical protein
MSRRIITVVPQAGGDNKTKTSSYTEKVVGYIPSDVVAAYITAAGIVTAASGVPQNTLLWTIFSVGVVFTALWTNHLTKEENKPMAIGQIIISTIAFAIWSFALGGPFASLAWYNTVYGSLLLIGYTLLVPLVPIHQT